MTNLLTPFFIFLFSLTTALAAQKSPEDQTKALYENYSANVSLLFSSLVSTIEKNAPDMKKELLPKAPKKIQSGYQVLPQVDWKITLPPLNAPNKPLTNTYSWPQTQKYLFMEKPKLEDFKEKLAAVEKVEKKDKRPLIKSLIEDFKALDDSRVWIDSHIKHNSFWQPIINKDRTRFDPANQTEVKIEVPTFLKIINPSPTHTVISVPVFTDIEDQNFLHKFKATVEKVWRVESRESTYSLELNLKKFKPKNTPQRFESFDIKKHVTQFPANAGVLTTGALATYAIAGRFVALGPHQVNALVLAHEFGHILGFVDTYVRTYRDLTNEGLEVIETVPDPTDLMCAPGQGRVLKKHFDKLLEQLHHPN